jgi:peptide/nickel transport system substrate-binding protein
LALTLTACAPAAPAAPAADTGAAAEPAAAAAAATGDLPATPGRGTDGTVTLVYWQEISILNPYLSNGTKDNHGASLILEPLVKFAPDGSVVPALVEEVPTVENGGIAEDLMSITYKLRDDIVWSDGTPLTADDVIFTWQYCSTPETGCAQAASFAGVTAVEAGEGNTVTITFEGPKPYPYSAFAGQLAPVLQKAQFEGCVGAAAQGCSEQNTNPIGTGPYKVREFRANDTVVYEVNENYRVPDQPHFAEVIIKGAEDASASARAVLETGEADYAWNLQVEPDILNEMVARGNGELLSAFGGNVERILFNPTNVDPALGDMRSEWTPDDPNPHPFLSDPVVRQALSIAIDRNIINEQLYGAGGQATCNVLSGPPAAASPNNDACLTQDIEGAKALLEGAGWVDSNGDGIREKDGVEMRVLYQTSTNSVRQKTQALVQQWWQEIGVAAELKNVEAAVYFGGDPASPDTIGKFFADVEMFTSTMDNPDPETLMSGFLCFLPDGSVNIANSGNQWLGVNIDRYCNPEYDAKFPELTNAVGDARNQVAIELNDMIANDWANAPIIFRASVSARVNSLEGVDMNGWDSEEWNIAEWRRAR